MKTFTNPEKPHLLLVELRHIVAKTIRAATNQLYGRNIKVSYRTNFYKGDNVITGDNNEEITNYYVMELILEDKTTTTLPKILILYNNYYPAKIGASVFEIEEEALKDLIVNGIFSLINVLYSNYLYTKDNKVVEGSDITETPNQKVEITKEIKKPKLLTTTSDFKC